MTKEQLQKAITTLTETIGFCQYEYRSCQDANLKQNIDNLVELRDHLRAMYEATTMVTESDFHMQQTLKGRVITSDEVRHNMARAANMMRR